MRCGAYPAICGGIKNWSFDFVVVRLGIVGWLAATYFLRGNFLSFN